MSRATDPVTQQELAKSLTEIDGRLMAAKEILDNYHERLNGLLVALETLGQIVKLQGERIERLEDKE